MMRTGPDAEGLSAARGPQDASALARTRPSARPLRYRRPISVPRLHGGSRDPARLAAPRIRSSVPPREDKPRPHGSSRPAKDSLLRAGLLAPGSVPPRRLPILADSGMSGAGLAGYSCGNSAGLVTGLPFCVPLAREPVTMVILVRPLRAGQAALRAPDTRPRGDRKRPWRAAHCALPYQPSRPPGRARSRCCALVADAANR